MGIYHPSGAKMQTDAEGQEELGGFLLELMTLILMEVTSP